MKPTDPIIGPSKGTLRQALLYAAVLFGPNGNDPVRRYIEEVFRVAPLVGVSADIVVSQSAHETAEDHGNGRGYVPWTSSWWMTRLNPAGMGVTGDPAQNEASPTFASPEHAARAQISHLLVYALGPADAGSRWFRAMGESIANADPRYVAYVDAYGNVAKATTLAGLAGTWATDPAYAAKVATRGTSIFGASGEPTPAHFPFSIDLTARNNGRLTDAVAWITIHNNGNPTSDRFDEREFVNNGGGDAGVMYHGAIDSGGVIQIMPLDKQGVHAGNTQGNRTSIAFEMCEGSEPWADVKEHTSQMLAEIVTNRRGILDYGAFGPGNFSLDRVREHRDWPGANPNCPRRLIQTDGGVEKIVARARQIVAAGQTDPNPEPPIDSIFPAGMDEDLADRLFGIVEASGADGEEHTYSFNPDGGVGRLWLARGKETGSWPALNDVEVIGQKTYYLFDGGLILWRESDDDPVMVLKAG